VVPLYHPDFEDTEHAYDPGAGDSSGSDEYEDPPPVRHAPRVRRGSEGPELLPVDREEMLRRYVASETVRDGRYQRYVPEAPSEDEDEEQDNVPLAQVQSRLTV
jgi:hypothetical protein